MSRAELMMKNMSSTDAAICESDHSSKTIMSVKTNHVETNVQIPSERVGKVRINIGSSTHKISMKEEEGRKKSKKDKQVSEEEEMTLTSGRERKKSKYLSPPYTAMAMRSVSFKRAAKADLLSKAFNDDDPLRKVIARLVQMVRKRKRLTNVAVIDMDIAASSMKESVKQDSDHENHVAVALQVDTPAPKKAILVIRFTPGSTYPSKKELIQLFSEFGQVTEAEVELIQNTGCARLVFLNSAACEKAFDGLDKMNLLGYSVASYRLRYLSSTSSKGRSKKPISHPSAGDGAAADQDSLESIKKNLDCILMTLKQAGPGSHLSSEIRSSLMVEFGGLLEKITNLLKSATS